MSTEKKRRLVIKESSDGGYIWVYGGLAYQLRSVLKELGFKWDPKDKQWKRRVDTVLESTDEIINELLKRVSEKVKMRKVKGFTVWAERDFPEAWGEVYEEESGEEGRV
ncbi:hypothetical protein [Pyrobaculum sp.]|uniref:hypothetical protein n=1 Tax=Pyrobaculum sp. TaxID=2004705 RepID=UPI003D13B6CD